MTQHVIPNDDKEQHEDSIMCDCDPKIIEVNGVKIVIHNAFDGREGVEWTNEILKQ